MTVLAMPKAIRARPDPIETAEHRERIRELAHQISQLMPALKDEQLRWVLIAPPTDNKPVQFIYEV